MVKYYTGIWLTWPEFDPQIKSTWPKIWDFFARNEAWPQMDPILGSILYFQWCLYSVSQ